MLNNKYYGFRALIEICKKKNYPNRNQNVSDDSFNKKNQHKFTKIAKSARKQCALNK